MFQVEGRFIGYEPHPLIWGASQFPKGSRLPVALFGRTFRGPPTPPDEALPDPEQEGRLGVVEHVGLMSA